MLRVLSSAFKPVLQIVWAWSQVSCMNTDFWMDKISRESRHIRVLSHLLQDKIALDR